MPHVVGYSCKMSKDVYLCNWRTKLLYLTTAKKNSMVELTMMISLAEERESTMI